MARAESLRRKQGSPEAAGDTHQYAADTKKSRAGTLTDRFELEADRAASWVMRGQYSAHAMSTDGALGLQKQQLNIVADGAGTNVNQALSSQGQDLDISTRNYFEPRYGHDFGKVRIHADEQASRSAASVGARAYTVGNDVVFAKDQYSPHTSAGRHLIAHELAHVLQQGGGNQTIGLAGTTPRLQCQMFAPPPQSGGFQRGFNQDVEYLRNYDPVEEAKRKASIAREKAITEALKPFKDAVLGEFEEDPSTAGILIDTGLGLIPIVDQGLDLRDIIAHIFMMSERGQHKSPGRWLGVALTLIGVVPEIGSAVKGAAKLLIKKGAKGAAALVGFLSHALKVSADLPGLATRFRLLVAKHWSSWVSGGKRAFTSAITRAESFLETVKATDLLKRVRAVHKMAGKMLDDAFERLRKQIDDALDEISPQMVPAGGPGGKLKVPDPPAKAAPMQTTGSGAGKPTKNEYPDFEAPKAADAKIVQGKTAALSKQLGLNIPVDRVLEAPWVGRVYGSAGKKLSSGTSEGWLRNEGKFWSLFKSKFPDDYKLLDQGETISAAFAKKYGWAKVYIGQKLVHHHLDNGPFVVAIPESLHRRLSGVIHAKPTVVK